MHWRAPINVCKQSDGDWWRIFGRTHNQSQFECLNRAFHNQRRLHFRILNDLSKTKVINFLFGLLLLLCINISGTMPIVYCDFVAGCIGGKQRNLAMKFEWLVQKCEIRGEFFYSGACGILIGHPMDTIKTWQQAGNTRIARTMYEIILRNNGVGTPSLRLWN